MSRTFSRGDVIALPFDPALGTEQQGTRPALVLSPATFNRLGQALVCPITQGGNFARGSGWAVSLTGTGMLTAGVVLCNQVRTLDWRVRQARFIEAAPADLVDEVLARVQTLLD